jgi:uncharacterized protein (TIGR02266 family)
MSGAVEDSGQEQRRCPRVTLPREVSCEGDAERVQSQFADISLGGMFIDTPRQPFPPGATVRVKFLLTPLEPRVTANAEVTYVQEKLGMGLRFVDLDPDARDRIGRYVDDVVSKKLPASDLHARKSSRVSISILVKMTGDTTDGAPFDEEARIITLSKHGACVQTGVRLLPGARLFLTTPNGLEFKATVVWLGLAASHSDGQVGIQSRGLAQALGFEFP